MKPLRYYHCTPDRTDYLQLAPGKLRILLSAYRLMKFPNTLRRHIHLAKELFLDSGMISAWKKGDILWALNQANIIKAGNKLNADYVAMLDLPMEPRMLAKNGVSARKALDATLNNALDFMQAQVNGVKVFVIQGYELSEYRRCIDAYQDLGVFDLPNTWIAIGSICMRSPKKGLYDVCRLVRGCVPNHHLHAFGIGRKEWIDRLRGIGIDSFDSASASMNVAFNRGFCRVEGKRNNKQVCEQFAQEMLAYENHLKGKSP